MFIVYTHTGQAAFGVVGCLTTSVESTYVMTIWVHILNKWRMSFSEDVSILRSIHGPSTHVAPLTKIPAQKCTLMGCVAFIFSFADSPSL